MSSEWKHTSHVGKQELNEETVAQAQGELQNWPLYTLSISHPVQGTKHVRRKANMKRTEIEGRGKRRWLTSSRPRTTWC